MAEKSLPNQNLRNRFLALAFRFGEEPVIDYVTLRMGWEKTRGAQPQTTFDRRHGFRVLIGLDRDKAGEYRTEIPHQRAGQVHRLLGEIERNGSVGAAPEPSCLPPGIGAHTANPAGSPKVRDVTPRAAA
jgi:hypothetical protein